MNLEPKAISIGDAFKRGIVCIACGARFNDSKLKTGFVYYESETFGTVGRRALICPQCGSDEMDFALNGSV